MIRLFSYLLLSLTFIAPAIAQNQSELNGGYQVQGMEYLVHFNNGEAKLHLTPNQCISNYTILDSNQVTFDENIACTEICCDDENDEAFKRQIDRVKSYSINHEKLYLFGMDTLVLIKKE
jgi:hypothetical protein